MIPKRKALPLLPIVAGLLGLSLFLIGHRSNWAIIPDDDFARWLWIGLCFGAELLGAILLFKTRPRVTSGSSRQ
jgi:hypothetical protein